MSLFYGFSTPGQISFTDFPCFSASGAVSGGVAGRTLYLNGALQQFNVVLDLQSADQTASSFTGTAQFLDAQGNLVNSCITSTGVIVPLGNGLAAALLIGGFPLPPGPTITTSVLPSGTVGVSYSAVVGATVGIVPFGWSIFSGALPPGLSLSPISGQPLNIGITGTPVTAGTYDFTIRVGDDVSPPRYATKDLRIVIN